MEEQVFNADETGLFYKNVGKRTYVMQMASKTPGFKSFKDCATLLLCANAKGDFIIHMETVQLTRVANDFLVG